MGVLQTNKAVKKGGRDAQCCCLKSSKCHNPRDGRRIADLDFREGELIHSFLAADRGRKRQLCHKNCERALDETAHSFRALIQPLSANESTSPLKKETDETDEGGGQRLQRRNCPRLLLPVTKHPKTSNITAATTYLRRRSEHGDHSRNSESLRHRGFHTYLSREPKSR